MPPIGQQITSKPESTRIPDLALVEPEFECIPVATRWLSAEDSLNEALLEHLPSLTSGDTVVVSEKVAILLSGETVPISDYPPGRMARLLAGSVKPRFGSRGLSVPEKMEFVIQSIGLPRIMLAAVVWALTRRLGRRGDFYRIAGSVARDLDGGRPPYEQVLFPPLKPETATRICNRLERELGCAVAIIDLNDYGGSIRGTSAGAGPVDTLLDALADNPLGQRSTGTPFGVLRHRVSEAGG